MKVDARQDRTGATSERRREEVILVATVAFAEMGYQGASLREIADRCGLGQGHLYYYYRNKQDLLVEILQGLQSRYDRLIEDTLVDPRPTKVRLESLLSDHVAILCENHLAARVSYENIRFLTPDYREGLMANRRAYEEGLCALIDGVRDDIDVVDLPSHLLSKVLLGIVNWPYQWFRPGGTTDPDALSRQLAGRAMASLVTF